MSSAQFGIWFAQKLDPANPGYSMGEWVEIHGAVDPGLVEAAIRQSVADTEASRVRLSSRLGSGACRCPILQLLQSWTFLVLLPRVPLRSPWAEFFNRFAVSPTGPEKAAVLKAA